MDIQTIRREALRDLIKHRYDGVARQLAIAAKKPAGQINYMLSTPPRKTFGEKVARQIEHEMGLEPGYLDKPPLAYGKNDKATPPKANQGAALYDFETAPIKEVVNLMSQLNEDRQKQVISFTKHQINEQRMDDKNSTERVG